MKQIINTMFVSFALVCMSLVAYGQTDFIPTACATETFNVADGDSFFDPGGPGGDCLGTTVVAGNYPNSGCVTTTTLSAPGNLTVTFNDFGVFATFDWLVLTDVATGTVLYDNQAGGINAGDQFLADMMASAGTTSFTSTTGAIEFMFNATAVVNSCGWDVSIAAAAATCDITCPAAISVDNDPGTCGALVTVPAPTLDGAGCATLVEVLAEDFDAGVLPAGWTLDDGGAGFPTAGACGATLFSFQCTGGYPSSAGAGPAAGFAGNQATIDDDAVGAGAVGVYCIVTPAMDIDMGGALSGQSVNFDWQHEAVAGSGELLVDVSTDGTTWTNEISVDDDANGNATIDLSAYVSATTQIRFCYDDEGGFNWGAAFDNVVVSAADASAAVVTNDSPFATSTTDASGTYPVGTTTVTLTVTDAAGNVDSCSFDVTVIPYTPTDDVFICNDQINISLDRTCCAIITADMILEGNDYGCYDDYCVEITDADGNVIGTTDSLGNYVAKVTSEHVGDTLIVSVGNCLTGNSCW